MISINYFYYVLGIILMLVGLNTFKDKTNPKRISSGLFWLLYGVLFLAGNWLPIQVIGALVVIVTLLAGFGKVRSGQHLERSLNQRLSDAKQLGNKLFIPALTIPVFAILGSIGFKYIYISANPLIEPQNITIISVGIGCIVATLLACVITREKPQQGLHEMRRLVDALSWAILLPQMLAMLGLVFSAAGVDKALASVMSEYINFDYKLIAVSIYVFGMALFTIVMGNAFVAFPIMMGAVGIPILIGHFSASPAMIAAIGMLSGYAGTLMTPMAANFNIIPAALLELKDRNMVIKVQIPSALGILLANFCLLLILV
ncbi:MAG: DUF979 domain-containing protein [Burkholderiales bacterium]|nr:DUF979 domain-containing protein [Burkholderiales bacterium]